MFLAGSPFSHEIDFSTGLPTGAVVYSLLDNTGQVMTGFNSVSVPVPAGAVSVTIFIPGTAHTVNTPLFETRTLVWHYNTTAGTVAGQLRYRVEKDILFPVSANGVRAKLGVEPHEISDDQIDLLTAYSNLGALYEDNALVPYATSGDRNTLLIANAIEAMAALALIPSLQLAVAQKESSGTNSYARFSGVDFNALADSLTAYLLPLNALITPLDDGTDVLFAFRAVVLPDVITGATTT